ncbi:MAG: hypothetical protein PHS88_02855 [Candidatus Omnitrophica bacterium]|nr:hypothetical protein [Candidatus Omnitrophota bacterium]
MDDIDRRLLSLLEQGIPIQLQPYDALAKKIGMDVADLLLRISTMKADGVIRQISGIFDTRRLGYQFALGAMSLPAEIVEYGENIIFDHPGVGFVCRRPHEFNVWFSLYVPPMTLAEDHMHRLHRLSGSHRTLLLPAIRCFKSGATACAADEVWENEREHETDDRVPSRVILPDLTPTDIECIRVLQEDLPLVDEPFQKLAEGLKLGEVAFLQLLRGLVQRGYLRRMAAVVPFRRARAVSGATIAWQVPQERRQEVGKGIASNPEVCGCCQRATYPDFPYSIYAVVRSGERDECEALAREIGSKVGFWPHVILTNLSERKKGRLKYFDEGLDAWWDRTRKGLQPVFSFMGEVRSDQDTDKDQDVVDSLME